ncbi:hypothetical protein JCM1841_006521 [Sporobolomyces salmonicolor]
MTDWADLTSTLRKTRGECPPPLVGASVTLINDAVYVFGGRPVNSREMVCTLYSLDLRTLVWTKLWPKAEAERAGASGEEGPSPRYFHSAEAWEDKLLLFGGQSFVVEAESGSKPEGEREHEPEGHLETLDELWLFDTSQRTWLSPPTTVQEGVLRRPTPRYAHLAVVTSSSSHPYVGFDEDPLPSSTSSRLVIIGGQDFQNNYLCEMSVLDLDSMTWIAEAPFPRKAGSYRSAGAASKASLAPLETRPNGDDELVHSSHSVPSTEDNPEPIYVFSNTNFANPRRDLDLIPSPVNSFTIPAYISLSDRMVGEPSFPPGIRFPGIYSCGSRHLVLSGADVGVDRAEYVLWSLDLGELGGTGVLKRGGKMPWTRIPVDEALESGSWGPAVGWRNTLVVVGDKDRDMMDDYHSRQTNFATVAFIDLESFGIYESPPQPLAAPSQTLGLLSLTQPQLFDFELICSDKERLGCNRNILESRWPWFSDELAALAATTSAAIEAKGQRATGSDEVVLEDASDDEPIDVLHRVGSPGSQTRLSLSTPPSKTLFPITARSLELPLGSQEVKALLQYFHTLALSTPLQRSIPILTSLLLFVKTYNILPNLRALVVHALHESLVPENAAKIYEAAALGHSKALQIRAMQVMVGTCRPSAAATSEMDGSSRSGSLPNTNHEPLYLGQSQRSGRFTQSDHGNGTTAVSPLPSTPSSPPGSMSTQSGYPFQRLPPPSSSLPSLPGPPPILHPAGNLSRSSSLVTDRASSCGSSYTSSSKRSSYASSSHSHGYPHSVAAYPPPRPSLSLPPLPIAASTPSRIVDAWREGEERDRRQRAEAARLAAEAELSRKRLSSERKASVPTISAGSTLNSIPEQDQGLQLPPMHDTGSAFSLAPTPSVQMYKDSDIGSIETSSSGQDSNSTGTSSEKAATVAATAGHLAAKVVKKGFFNSFMGGDLVVHNAGAKAAPIAQGPPVRKVYPPPRPRYPGKGKKGDDAASQLSGTS